MVGPGPKEGRVFRSKRLSVAASKRTKLLRFLLFPQTIEKGSFEWLSQQDFVSGKFKKFAAGSQNSRKGVLNSIINDHGWKPYAQVSSKGVIKIMYEKEDTPAAANNRLKAISALYTWAIRMKLMPKQKR